MLVLTAAVSARRPWRRRPDARLPSLSPPTRYSASFDRAARTGTRAAAAALITKLTSRDGASGLRGADDLEHHDAVRGHAGGRVRVVKLPRSFWRVEVADGRGAAGRPIWLQVTEIDAAEPERLNSATARVLVPVSGLDQTCRFVGRRGHQRRPACPAGPGRRRSTSGLVRMAKVVASCCAVSLPAMSGAAMIDHRLKCERSSSVVIPSADLQHVGVVPVAGAGVRGQRLRRRSMRPMHRRPAGVDVDPVRHMLPTARRPSSWANACAGAVDRVDAVEDRPAGRAPGRRASSAKLRQRPARSCRTSGSPRPTSERLRVLRLVAEAAARRSVPAQVRRSCAGDS